MRAIDLHADTVQRITDHKVDIGTLSRDGHVDVPRMRQGGLGTQFFSIWVQPQRFRGEKAVDRTWRLIDDLKAQIHRCPDLELALSAEDIERIDASGQIAAAMGIEGGHSIHGRLDLLEQFFEAGVRYMTLTWSNSNEICGSSGDCGREQGLTPFGREVVKLMNHLGMMVDISHVSDRAFFEVLDLTERSPIASHSNTRRLCSHPRNLTDDMLKALAKRDGVVGINFFPLFLDDRFQEYFKGDVKISYKRVVDHIDHAVQVAGIDHVAIGSDYDGIPAVPEGLEDISKLPVLAEELLSRGYKPQDIDKIFHANIMRVFKASQVV